MTDRQDLDPDLTADERAQLARMSERLERDRPLPRATFRGDLRRSLLAGGRAPAAVGLGRWRVLVATYSGLGALLLAVAAIGLAGAGPFAA
jgi:nitroreductase